MIGFGMENMINEMVDSDKDSEQQCVHNLYSTWTASSDLSKHYYVHYVCVT